MRGESTVMLGFFAALERGFFRLVNLKERVLGVFFSLPWVRPAFRYITPNDLCYLRILAAIVILFLYLAGHRVWLFPIFLLAVIFDFIDGPLARATNQVSEEGKNLDPVADKVLISIPLFLIGMQVFGSLTISMFLLVEGLLVLTANYLKPYLREKYGIPLTSGANVFGQIKMTIQAVAVGIILLCPVDPRVIMVAEVLVWLGIGFGIGSLLRHLARMDTSVEPRKRIITVPNLITMSGLFLFIPAGFALTYRHWILAGFLIGWIFVSDWLDGWLARRYHQETAFGAAIDPLRDYLGRFLVMFWFFGQLESWLARMVIVIIVTVEIIAGVVNMATAKRCKTTQLVNHWGKVRAFVHYCLVGVLFFHVVGVYHLPSQGVIAILFVMFLFSLLSLISYVDQRRQLLQSKGRPE